MGLAGSAAIAAQSPPGSHAALTATPRCFKLRLKGVALSYQLRADAEKLFAVAMFAVGDAALRTKLEDYRARQTEMARAMTADLK